MPLQRARTCGDARACQQAIRPGVQLERPSRLTAGRRSRRRLDDSPRRPGGQLRSGGCRESGWRQQKGRAISPSHTPKECCNGSLRSAAPKRPFECVLIAAGLPGLFLFLRRDPTSRLGVRSASARPGSAGVTWPARAGRSTSCSPAGIRLRSYTALAVAGGAALDELLKRLRGPQRHRRLDRWAMAGAVLIGIRMIGYPGYPAFDSLRGVVRARAVSLEPPDSAGSLDRRSRRPPSQAGRAPALRGRRIRPSTACPSLSRADD